jgi:hypothetical protein
MRSERKLIRRFATLGAVLAVGGCAWLEDVTGLSGKPAAQAPEPTPVTASRAPEVPVPGRKPSPPAGGTIATLPSGSVMPGAASPPPAVAVAPIPEGPRLRHLAPEEVVQLLGEPLRRREEASAIVWTYASRNCELDLYFFSTVSPQANTRVSRVLDYVPRVGDPQRCVDELAAERRSRTAVSGSDRAR